MLGLRIECVAENFFDEDLAAPGRGDGPNQRASYQRRRPKPWLSDDVDLGIDRVTFENRARLS